MQSENAKIFLPIGSTWISANAGSGKTYNLVNRVIKLLVLGVQAKKILCITFTNSAADEMKIRLFDRLGEWVMMPEAELLVQIESLLGIELTNAKSIYIYDQTIQTAISSYDLLMDVAKYTWNQEDLGLTTDLFLDIIEIDEKYTYKDRLEYLKKSSKT